MLFGKYGIISISTRHSLFNFVSFYLVCSVGGQGDNGGDEEAAGVSGTLAEEKGWSLKAEGKATVSSRGSFDCRGDDGRSSSG